MHKQGALAGQLDRLWVAGAGASRADSAAVQGVVSALNATLQPDQVISDRERLLAFSYDATGERHWPDVVVFAQSAQEVETAVQIAAAQGVYILARGSSSNLSGGTTPVLGGLILSLTRMNHIRHVDVLNRQAVVEPGVINADLQVALQSWHFFYPPDPASHRISTLGGNVAENSGGPHCVKYGVTVNHIIQLEVVLADGRRLLTPTARDYRVGLDITGLLTGSEGTMAIVTQITAQIAPQPEQTATMLAVFASVDEALHTVSAIIAHHIVPSTLELLDKKSLEIVESFVHAGYPVDAGAVLLIEVDGPSAVVQAQTAAIADIAAQGGAHEFRIAQSALEADALWKGRRAHYGAAARIAPHLWIQDVTVPRPLLAEMMRDVIVIGQHHGFNIFCSAHAGDGNLHPIITYDPANADEVARMRQADHDILAACVNRGGAITGEHGIGIDKLENLALMYGPRERQTMSDLKHAFDPNGVLNPLKVVLPPPVRPSDPHWEEPSDHTWTPNTAQEASQAVMDARQAGIQLSVGGYFTGWAMTGRPLTTPLSTSHLRQIVDFDKDNLTVEVEAGMSASELAQWLRHEGLQSPFLPYSSPKTTVGGMIAANARNWRHAYLLGWRDVVLGVEWIDGRGQILRFGRKTMKNVAGYDVTKLAIGSWGRLGLISKAILRLRPLAPQRLLGYTQSDTVDRLLDMALQFGTSASRPDGVVITRLKPGQAQLWIAHESPGAEPIKAWVEGQGREAGLTWTWLEDDAWVSWEDERTRLWQQALQHGTYAEGGVLPTHLSHVINRVALDHLFIVYPASGAYEIFAGPNDVPLNLEGLSRRISEGQYWQQPTDGWDATQDRIRHVFDPDGIFGPSKSRT
ncbi:FAD-binding oxidoreductase [Sulfobacillus sp. hq2]|uniref:FAD-binding oxidoreductase n=1 Tax=Sulfobacillus sp. hq2 TaxID=2039167 RepID=UPI000CD0E6C5|nr:FAD-binding oxidoreductase [Sulfobacillus sp. hq2]POB09112.1 lactate dehydrogenase [Sulfobacillus sp. hq2]